jgi:hypothetical protein
MFLVMFRLHPKNWEIYNLQNPTKTKYNEIEPNLSKDREISEGDNPSFWNEFRDFVLAVQFRSMFQAQKALLNDWAVETLRDLQSTSRGVNPGVKM